VAARQPNVRKRATRSGGARTRLRDAEILATAAEVFARRGYAAATVQEVADELGMLKGSIYYYISSKEDLLFRLLSAVHDDVDAVLEQVLSLPDLDPLERLCEYVRRQIAYNLGNLVQVSVYYSDIDQLGGDGRAEILRRRRAHEAPVVELVLEGQRQGLIDDRWDPAVLAYHVFAAIIWVYRWFKPQGRIAAAPVIEETVAFVRGGLAPQ
jgi:AcrR family transcriptional regulator